MNGEKQKNNEISLALSLNDSLFFKGFAICFMLWHHLFYTHPEYGTFVYQTAQLAKACVAMFLFISGYGLAASYENQNVYLSKGLTRKIHFLLKRFVKFYINYWVIFIIFVPLSIFVFGRNLYDAYGSDVNVTKWLMIDIVGLAGASSFNPTWWFNQLIIYLYLLFPLLFILIKRWWFPSLIFVLLLLKFHGVKILVPSYWLFYFVIGIAYALNSNKISAKSKQYSLIVKFTATILICLFLLFRFGLLNTWSGTKFDEFTTMGIIFFLIYKLKENHLIQHIFRYLGKHSINIYLIHTFIFHYWFESYIYSFQRPIYIFVVLLLISLTLSIILEFIKSKIGVYYLLKQIENKLSSI